MRGEVPDVYIYDKIPEKLRIQVLQIIYEVLGSQADYYDRHYRHNIVEVYGSIVTTLRRELGVFTLLNTSHNDYHAELTYFLRHIKDEEQFLSALEIICESIETVASKFDYRRESYAQDITKDAILEINFRFKEHGIGYEYDGEIIRIDSELVHAEVIKPALSLLRDANYKGAEEEFLKGFEYYRKGNNKDALVYALKALESTMKSIFDKRGWSYVKTDPASKLIKVCFDNHLIPQFWESHFSALRSTLEAGVPTVRNKLGGHGQGTSPVKVPNHISAYSLHMAASAIVFLVQSEKEMP